MRKRISNGASALKSDPSYRFGRSSIDRTPNMLGILQIVVFLKSRVDIHTSLSVY